MPPLPHLRRMRSGDLPAVQAIERESFEKGWPATAFERELTGNGAARYVVVEYGGSREIAGFAGLWLMLDEAHIVSVAVPPAQRRHGLGRLLVLGLIETAIDEGMSDATLEVRVSNQAARALYRGFGFHDVGERKRYYADNGEDAVIMTTEALDSPAFRRYLDRQLDAISAIWPGIDTNVALNDPSEPRTE